MTREALPSRRHYTKRAHTFRHDSAKFPLSRSPKRDEEVEREPLFHQPLTKASMRPENQGDVCRAHHVVNVDEGVVDGDDVDRVLLDGGAQHEASDAAEAVDSNLGLRHACGGGS